MGVLFDMIQAFLSFEYFKANSYEPDAKTSKKGIIINIKTGIKIKNKV